MRKIKRGWLILKRLSCICATVLLALGFCLVHPAKEPDTDLSLLSLFLSGGASSAQAAEETYTNSIGMEFVLIPAGEFLMGSDKEKDPNAIDDEMPQHRVSISEPFYLGKFEVTQAQWVSVMENNPSWSKEPEDRNNPVDRVSWDDVQVFIARLNKQEGHNRYRLPTEAEWEYAARAGTTSAYSFGDDADSLARYAWYMGNSEGKTHPVGQKEPNAWGLYDMHGNVAEWVQDWYGEEYYSNSPSADPKGPSSGSSRVWRGGSWGHGARICRSAVHDDETPDYFDGNIGFRLALSPE
jgi:formylglycine-generating enzyme required for sulfatase activity